MGEFKNAMFSSWCNSCTPKLAIHQIQLLPRIKSRHKRFFNFFFFHLLANKFMFFAFYENFEAVVPISYGDLSYLLMKGCEMTFDPVCT